MKTIFALFSEYDDAQRAVGTLAEEDFNEAEMNVILREDVARENLEVDLQEVDVKKTTAVGERTVSGLAFLLGGEQPVHVPGLGPVLAGGELATFVAKEAAATGNPDRGLKVALVNFGVPEDIAGKYQATVGGGGALVWLRTNDDRAPKATAVLHRSNTEHIDEHGS